MKPEKLKEALKGIVGIAITPMTEDRLINEVGIRKQLKFMVSNGIRNGNGVMVTTGSTGECGALSAVERKKVLEIALDEVGDDVPIIAGCNHSNVYETIDLVQHAEKAGAAGVMILAPYYYVPTDDVVLDFYKLVSDKSSIGIMLYNNLEVTHKDISVEVLDKLASESNVVGIKECTPNFVKMEYVARALRNKISVVNGHGEFLEPYAALAGTVGFISSTANFAPGLAVEMWKARSSNDYVKAVAIRNKLTPYLDLARTLGAIGGEPKVLSVLKRAAELAGGAGGPGRLPLRELSPEEDRQVQDALRTIGII